MDIMDILNLSHRLHLVFVEDGQLKSVCVSNGEICKEKKEVLVNAILDGERVETGSIIIRILYLTLFNNIFQLVVGK